MMVLARRGRAVSPVTSYLAIEPGVRPSTEGLEERRARVPDVIAGAAGVLGQPEAPRIDRQKFLEDELGRAWRDCGHERRASRVVLETTLAEVVDVPAVFVTGTRRGPLALPRGSGVGHRSPARVRSTLGPVDRGASAARPPAVSSRNAIAVDARMKGRRAQRRLPLGGPGATLNHT